MTLGYIEFKEAHRILNIPLAGYLDFTYRCNNTCRHCWLSIPANSLEREKELSFDEIRKIVGEARAMGCREWRISGGEPMLRDDFTELFDFITRNTVRYSINTNGTLITPKIAQLMRRKGVKMISLYGATAEVHDYITRRQGSFEETMRGIRYLKEAGAGFTVQVVPMKSNYHQFQDMVRLAKSFSKSYRLGASWLYFSASGKIRVNQEIKRQRLEPKLVVELDKPDVCFDESLGSYYPNSECTKEYMFSLCIRGKNDFYISPYGQMTFCYLIKDRRLKYDLRVGTFKEAWEKFIPSLANKVKITEEYKKNCGSCNLSKHCSYCPVYGYLEHGRFGARVNYLCKIARENKKFKENWIRKHRRYYRIADITIQIDSDLPFKKETFHPKFKHFEISELEQDTIFIRHHFSLPDLSGRDLGQEFYRKPPWAIYNKNGSWVYLGISPDKSDKRLHRVVVFSSDHTHAKIYNENETVFLKGNLDSLTLFPSDQILLARILADRKGCFLHSCGVDFNGKGLLFVGHSGAGKSTMAKLLKGKAKILCDDRIIVRKYEDGFKIFGTWSHGTVPDISPDSCPLKNIFFLRKAKYNRIIPVTDKKSLVKNLLSYIIRPLVTRDWWEKTLELVDEIITSVPCYELYFEENGKIVKLLERLIE